MRHDKLILCYHAVSDSWPADLSISPRTLEEQVGGLLRAGYVGTTLSGSRAPGAKRRLVVSFDDGYASMATLAAPVLARLGVPGTLFVPTDYVGSDRLVWPGIEQWLDGPHAEELRPLDWDGVRALAEAGWEIGAHTRSHPHLTALGDAELARELGESKAVIERELARPCPTVAYPYGDVDHRVTRAAAAAGYTIGVGLPARWTDDSDPLCLPRVGVYNGATPLKFKIKTSPTVRRLRVLIGR
jgi:peptidoglycan/xylan/chitin deacetylase (PgdA/CDA1 family)